MDSPRTTSPESGQAVADGGPGCQVGIALSGGGARGFAHIGALRALEEAGIPIDCIAGASMGALIGALYAGGNSIEEIQALTAEIDWYRIFTKPMEGPIIPAWHRLHDTRPLVDLRFDYWAVSLPESMLPDQRMNEMLMRLLAEPGFLAEGDFDNLPIPYRAVATDLTSGERVILSGGDLSRSVRASISVPLAFPPVVVNDRLLIDGGLVDNLPIGVVRDMGARLVLAVDVSSPPIDVSITRDIISVAGGVGDILSRQVNASYAEPADLVVKPELHGHTFSDYTQWEHVSEWGYEATAAVTDEILARMRDLGISTDGAPPAGASARAGRRPLDGRPIAEIRVLGNRRIPESRIVRGLGFDLGDPFLLKQALAGVERLYATGFFELVWLDYRATSDGEVIIILEVEEESGTLGLGASYNEDDRVSGFARWRLRNIFSSRQQFQLDVYGGDRRSGFDLRLSANRLLATGIGYELRTVLREDKPRFFEDGEYVNRAKFTRQGASLGGVIPLTTAGRVRFDYTAEDVEIGDRAGLPFEPVTNRLRRFDAALFWSNLDDLDLPTRGLAASFDLQKSTPWLGASVEYLRTELRFRLAAPLGARNVLYFDFMGGLSWDDLPVHEYFMIGGPVLVPGYNREEFWGRQALAVSAGYGFSFAPGFQLTVRGGGGNVWQSRDEIDLGSIRWGGGAGLQYLTPFGPIGGSVGINDDGKAEVYFWVGYQ